MNFCSHCASPVEKRIPAEDDRPRFVCRSCGMVHYDNPKLVVGCIPEWQGDVLLCLRDIEPRRGKWTLPAGYLENGETVMEGARRETLEETGAAVEALSPYLMFDIVYVNQIYLMFRSHLVAPHFHVTRESADVRLFSEAEIPWKEIAFPAIEQTLIHYFSDRSEGDFPFQINQIRSKLNSD